MLNYIKSELYRLIRNRNLYIVVVAFILLPILYNGLLWITNSPELVKMRTYYGSFGFLITCSFMVFSVGVLTVINALYSGNKENGNDNNSIAYGISRTKLFVGKCVAGTVFTLAIMILALTSWIISAVALLKPDNTFTIMDVAKGALVLTPFVISQVILLVALLSRFGKGMFGVFIWMVIMIALPMMMANWLPSLLHMPLLADIAQWMPYNFLESSHVVVNGTLLWNTTAGVVKCLIAGSSGIAIFGLAGWLSLRREEV